MKNIIKRWRIYFYDNDRQISPEMFDCNCSRKDAEKHADKFRKAGYKYVSFRELKDWEK